MKGSLGRFLVVGGTTVLIDALVYQALLLVGVPLDPAKALGFIGGAFFAYVANWRYTFRGAHHRWSVPLFVGVYLCALLLNVAVNAGVLRLLGDDGPWPVAIAFVVATGVSAAWNFAGMARLVFRSPATDRAPEEVGHRG